MDPKLRIDRLTRLHDEKVNELRVVRRALATKELNIELLKESKRRVVDLEARVKKAEASMKLLNALRDSAPHKPKWAAPRRAPKGTHHATPTLLLSDLHLDEVVDPSGVDWYNAYDRQIAELRLTKAFEDTVKVTTQFMNGLTFDGIVCALLGDIVTGDIHAELSKTNETTTYDTIVYWVPKLAAGISMLADTFGKVYVPCVSGNHDRNPMYHRVPMKRKAKESLSWIIYNWLADFFANDDRVTFQISETGDLRWDIYAHRFNATHGDQFRGGDGIIGPLGPITRGNNRKGARNQVLNRPYDTLVFGHFHQYMIGRDLMGNGSLKGYDEYAHESNFLPEPPCQALFINTPENGITFRTPIYVTDDAEPWLKKAKQMKSGIYRL